MGSDGATMDVLILGNGDEELAWARWLLGRGEHRLDAAFPGFGDPALAGIPTPRDLDDALARAGIDTVIVADLPMRLHPGVIALRQALSTGELGTFRALRWDAAASDSGTDLARVAFPRIVDVVRALLGEIEALTATGDPPGEAPDLE